MASKAIEELRAASYNCWRSCGVRPGSNLAVYLNDAERIVGELEAQLERHQIDLPLACPHCKKLIGYDVEEQHD